MNYVTGSLEMFKTTVEELRKEDELCDIATEVMGRIKEAVMNREVSIQIDEELIEPVREQLVDEGYSINYHRCSGLVEVRGWS